MSAWPSPVPNRFSPKLYKTHGPESVCRGGPSFHIARSFGLPWLGGAFGIPKLATGLVLAGLAALVIFGGIRKIATVAE